MSKKIFINCITDLHSHVSLHPAEYFLKGVLKTRNAGISRNMPEYHGIWRNITEYHDIFPEYTGTSQYFPMVAMRLFINMDV
jgi:hypothetical protein